MRTSRFSEQRIASILKQADDGLSVEEVCRKAGISQQTYYRWRKKYGGLMPSEGKRLKMLEDENSRLERMVADLSLDKAMASLCPPWVRGQWRADVLQKKTAEPARGRSWSTTSRARSGSRSGAVARSWACRNRPITTGRAYPRRRH